MSETKNTETKKNVYNPKEIEESYYKLWEERNYFEIEGNKSIQKPDKHFTIMMPPPNVTGRLHIGHALTFTLQDIIVRYKRMDGYKTLWQPGVDHAGIATQNVVEKQLLSEGTTKESIGREAFLERAWLQKENSQDAITGQLRKLGVSPAWSRERFTMDEGLGNAVKKSFKQMYDNGFIVRGNYMINWCTHDGALSDIEVEHEDHMGKMYHINYPLADGSGNITVATTRPETYFGDTAVMVHPDDTRHNGLIGKKIKLPLIDREVEIIGDEHVDMEFGTGFVKVTPAHDTNDYEVGKRHDLEFITIFDEKGFLNEHCGEFEGQERLEAREVIVKKLDEAGFMVKIEDHPHQVGHCYRCKNIVEPYISKQWFVKKEFAASAIEKVNNGEAEFFPSHWINTYNAWMGELRDWCISRQLWWGHQIPVFYCNDCDHEWVEEGDAPTCCSKCSSTNIYQDPDVLDTWFSSGLWPFSTLGWGNDETFKGELWNEDDMKNFYPNNLLITGFDIIFFWVARMLMMGENITGELPFKDIYLHALVKDENGEKMSKSKGNVIDPLETIEKYSTDALRFTLAVLAVQGRDIRLSDDKLEQSRNFTNKLFNATNFLQLNQEHFDDLDPANIKTPLGRYMLARFNVAVKETRDFMDVYRFNDAATVLYRFLWGEFCDWGIELSKADKASVAELGSIFKESMKLLHPFMPFITENLYMRLSEETLENGESIMVKAYPTPPKDKNGKNILDSKLSKKIYMDSHKVREFELIKEAIVAARRIKTQVSQKITEVSQKMPSTLDLDMMKPFIEKLGKVEKLTFVSERIQRIDTPEYQTYVITDISDNIETYIIIDDMDILDDIGSQIIKQKEKLDKEMNKLNGMMNNKRFVENAPKEVITKNKQALDDVKNKLLKVNADLSIYYSTVGDIESALLIKEENWTLDKNYSSAYYLAYAYFKHENQEKAKKYALLAVDDLKLKTEETFENEFKEIDSIYSEKILYEIIGNTLKVDELLAKLNILSKNSDNKDYIKFKELS